MYEANISPNSSHSSDFYTIKSSEVRAHSLEDFIEYLKEELSQFDPEDHPFAVIIEITKRWGEDPILQLSYTENFTFKIEEF